MTLYWCETDGHATHSAESHQTERGNSMKHGFTLLMVELFVLSLSGPLLA